MQNDSKILKKILAYVIAGTVIVMTIIIFLASGIWHGSGSILSDIYEGYEFIQSHMDKSLWDAAREALDKDIFDTGAALEAE